MDRVELELEVDNLRLKVVDLEEENAELREALAQRTERSEDVA